MAGIFSTIPSELHQAGLHGHGSVVPVRQTVLTGRVDANGQANFLEAGSGLTVDLKASQVPVEVAFAAGFHKGALDYVERIDDDIDAAWTLPPNATSYLYVDRDPNTGQLSYGLSALAPVYQSTAPAAPVIDQHWFDLSTMTMKVWSGSAWVEKQRVFIGEAVTNDTGVVSIITYALQGRYDSGWFPVLSDSGYIKDPKLGLLISGNCNVDYFFSPDGTDLASAPAHKLYVYGSSGYGFIPSFGSADGYKLSIRTDNYVQTYKQTVYTSGYYRVVVERNWGMGGGSAVAESDSTVEMGATEVPVRQTVLDGRTDAEGRANFLEAGEGLTVDLKATEKPVVLAFADGFGERGAIDYVKRITKDIPAAWTLPPNQTSYLYVDLDRNGNASFGLSAFPPHYGDVPEASTSGIAPMISNTIPSPYVASASSTWDSSYQPWRAFDKTNGPAGNSPNCWASANGSPTGWLAYDRGLSNHAKLAGYRVTSRNGGDGPSSAPKSWTIEGSNDGVEWSVLDSQSNQTGWTANETRIYTLAVVSDPYRHFRINVSANNGSAYVTIGELDLEVIEKRDWFDLSGFTLKARDGAGGFIKKLRLYVGEATTNESGITSLITYALRGRYDSRAFPVMGGGVYVKSHNIGAQPLVNRVLVRKGSGYQWSNADMAYANGHHYGTIGVTDRLTAYAGFGTFIGGGGGTVNSGTRSFPPGDHTSGEAKIIAERGW